MSNEDDRIAVLLIHGIGCQNKFDFLASFTQGLFGTEDGSDKIEKETERKLLKGVPAKLDGHGVDFFESYWSPMMTGATTIWSATAFIFGTMYRLLPFVRKTSRHSKNHDKSDRLQRWGLSVIGLGGALAVLGLFVFWSFGALVQATDRLWLMTNFLDEDERLHTPTILFAANGNPFQAQLNDLTEDLTKLRRGQPSATSNDELRKLEARLDTVRNNSRKWIMENEVQSVKVAANRNDLRRNLREDFLTSNVAEGVDLESREFSKLLEETGFVEDPQRPGEGAMPAQEPSPTGLDGLLRRSIDCLRAGFSFLLSSTTYVINRKDLSSVLPEWPEPHHALRAIEMKDALWLAVILACVWSLTATCAKSMLAYLFEGKERRERRNFIGSSVALILVWLLSFNFLFSDKPSLLFLVLALVLLGIASVLSTVMVRDTIGDLEIYMMRNANARKYRAKASVLEKVQEDVHCLLRSDNYHQVVVVGHSLGSVVGIEAIRKLFFECQTEHFSKLKAYVTLGSPLEKTVAFFAAGRSQEDFDVDRMDMDGDIFNGHRGWHNFYNSFDPIADSLESYKGVSNTHVSIRGTLWTHSAYWRRPGFTAPFKDILKQASGRYPARAAQPEE